MTTINDIQSAILASSAQWQAAETDQWRADSGAIPASTLFGLQIVANDPALVAAADSELDDLALPPLPVAIDWRTEEGGKVTAIKDQKQCGSCVAFATCAVMECAWWIKGDKVLSLSEGHLFHCNGGSCSAGWNFIAALEAARKGVGLAADLPYDPAGSCVQIAPALKVASYKLRTTLSARKRAVSQAPVVAGMTVYKDFMAYRGGVYEHLLGDVRGHHAVCVVGYSDADECWIVKNSWGSAFGEQGFFRIKYGQCGIDSTNPFYSVEVEG